MDNMKFSETCRFLAYYILYCGAGSDCLIRTLSLQVEYVASYHGYRIYHPRVFLRRHRSFFFEKAILLCGDILM